jgi:hypothetical protein
MKPWAAAILDVVCVAAFAALGVHAHAEADTLLRVAAPFLTALAVGWAVALPLRRPESLRAGLVIVLVTLVGGMLLRRVGGDGTAAAFVVVACGFLAVTMLGWRVLTLALLSAGTGEPPARGSHPRSLTGWMRAQQSPVNARHRPCNHS